MAQSTIEIILSLKSAQALTQLTGFLNSVGSGFKELALAAGVGFGIEYVKHLIETTEALGRMSEAFGTSIEEMAGFRYAADKADISLETFQSGIKFFAEQMEKTGQSGKSLREALGEQADILAKMPDGLAKTARANELFGRSAVQLIPLLNQGSEAINEMLERGERLSGVNERMAMVMKDAGDVWKDFKTVLGSVAAQIAMGTLPALTKLFEKMVIGLLEVRDAIEAFQNWAAGFGFNGLMSGKSGVMNGINPKDVPDVDENFLFKYQYEAKKKEIELAMQEAKISEANAKSDYTLSAEKQQTLLNKSYERQLTLLQKRKDLDSQYNVSGGITREERQALDAANDLKSAQLRAKVEPTGAAAVLKEIDLYMQRIPTMARQIGQAITQNIGTAVNAISSGITGWITGTKSFGQAMVQIYNTIVTSVVESIVKIGVQWFMTHVIMKGISELFRTTETASTAAHTGTQVAIHHTGETAKTGSTFLGVAARGVLRLGETIYHGFLTATKVAAHVAGEIAMTVVSLAQSAIRVGAILAEAIKWLFQAAFKGASAVADIPYVGPILAIAAIGAIIAAGVGAMGGFREQGGPVTAGTPYIVGEKRPELFVPSQNGYVVSHVPSGFGQQAQMSSPATQINQQFHVHSWNDAAAMNKHIKENPKATHILIDKFRKQGHVIGARQA